MKKIKWARDNVFGCVDRKKGIEENEVFDDSTADYIVSLGLGEIVGDVQPIAPAAPLAAGEEAKSLTPRRASDRT